MQCRACGKENSRGNAFCVFCGEALKGVQEQTVPEQSVQEQTVPEQSVQEQDAEESSTPAAQPEHLDATLAKSNKKRPVKLIATLSLFVLIGLGVGAGIIYNKGLGATANTDFEENYELSTMLGLKYTDWEDLEFGELYTQKIKGEPKFIANDVLSNSYVYSDVSGTLAYVDYGDNLYIVKEDAEPMHISENVSSYGLYFSNNGEYLFFASDLDYTQGYFYDIKNNTKERLSDCMLETVFMDEESEDVYYLDTSYDLYKRSKLGEKTLIASNVDEYKVTGKNQVLCRLSRANLTYAIYHLTENKIQEEAIEDIEYIELTGVETSHEEKLLCFVGYSTSNTHMSNLYMKLEGQEIVKVAEDVINYNYSEEYDSLYYITSDAILYQMSVPKISKKCFEDRNYFVRLLEDCKETVLLEDCTYFEASPDGKNILVETLSGDVYLCRKNMKTKLASDLMQQDIFNDYVVYRTFDNELFIQEGINNESIEKLEKPILLTDQAQGYYTTSLYGKYLTYTSLEGDENEPKIALKAYSKDTGIVNVLEDANTYDQVVINEFIYDRRLEYKEIVGNYASDDDHFLVKMESDGRFRIYSAGIEQSSTVPIYEDYNRNSLMVMDIDEGEVVVSLNPYDPYETTTMMTSATIITLLEDGSCEINVDAYTSYILTPITEETFNQKIEEQKQIEEERQRVEAERQRQEEEERQRREALEEMASHYYINGVYIQADSYIYNWHDYNDRSNYYTTNDSTWSVYDYYIDYDQSVIWVKIQYQPGSYYSWVDGWFPIG